MATTYSRRAVTRMVALMARMSPTFIRSLWRPPRADSLFPISICLETVEPENSDRSGVRFGRRGRRRNDGERRGRVADDESGFYSSIASETKHEVGA